MSRQDALADVSKADWLSFKTADTIKEQIRTLAREALDAVERPETVFYTLIAKLGELTGDDFWGEEVSHD